jgi:hypothetical protein
MEEIWKPLKDKFWGKYYEISNLGRVKSKQRIIKRKDGISFQKREQIIKSRTNKIENYLFVDLIITIDGIYYRKTAYIHKLLAEVFIKNPKPKEYKIVTHIDENPLNNSLINLKWTSQSLINSKIMSKPENRYTLRDINIKNGYYDKLRKRKNRKNKKQPVL